MGFFALLLHLNLERRTHGMEGRQYSISIPSKPVRLHFGYVHIANSNIVFRAQDDDAQQ